MNTVIDIAIIGGGAAGLTAGLYGARANLKTVLFEEFFPGGQTATVELLQNYPGYKDGIDGATLMQNMNEQATNAGMETRYEKITSIARKDGLTIFTESGEEILVKSVIIATGASPRKLGIPLEAKFTGKGIHYCATCDGAVYRNKTVMVNGGGNTALTDSLVLSSYADKVYLVHRKNAFTGDQVLIEKVIASPKIEIIYEHTIKSLVGDKRINSVIIANTKDDTQRTIELDGIFVAIGILPLSGFVKDTLELDRGGQIITDRTLLTSMEGVYAAGDVRDSQLRQVITAAGDGALATSSAMHYISKL